MPASDAPMALVYLVVLLVVVALLAPLIPMRRRKGGVGGFPYVTAGLMLANVLVFAATAKGFQIDPEVAMRWGVVPRSASLLTLFTHLFLHGGWDHLLANMIGLWLFGSHVEEALGRLEYLLFYLGGGVAAGFLHVLMASTLMPGAAGVPLVGASGALFAVLGLFAVRFWRAKVRVFLLFTVPAVWALALFGLYQLISGVAAFRDGGANEHMAHWAHVGGFLFGMLLAVPMKMGDASRQEYTLEDAEAAAAAGHLDMAAAYYRRFLAEKPDDAAAHRALGGVCVRLRQGEAAHRHFTDALRLYLRAGDSVGAAGVYGEAGQGFEAFPLPPQLLTRVASACEEAEQFPLAVQALSTLCRDFPDAREAEMGMIRLGRLHLTKLESPQNAAGVFAEFLRLYPASEFAHHARQLLAEANRAAALPVPSPPLPARTP
jgi:membrane associated rhomboid family serine protease